MSHTASPQAAPAPPATPAAPAAAALPTRAAAPQHVDTPMLLNRWQLVGMSVAILFGLLSALVQFGGWQADGRAADDTEQLVRVQEIQSSLLRADALATNAFLAGGLEDPAQRAEYDETIDDVLRLVAEAAEAQPADGAALAALNVEIVEYATGVAQARDYNRQRYPLGAEYLSGASTALGDDALPILGELVKANNERAEDAMAGQHPFWLLLIGIAAVAVLVWLNRELAKHFRRRINKGIAIATAIVLAVTVVSVIAAWARDSSNDSLRSEEFAAAVTESKARTAANSAKANESLRLIKRGSGALYEDRWQQAAEAVEGSETAYLGLWRSYVADHEEIVGLDESGDWEGAVGLATGTEGSTASLDEFDAATEASVESNRDAAIDDLRSGRVLALIVSALTVLLGLAAAVAVARGIGERRREFA